MAQAQQTQTSAGSTAPAAAAAAGTGTFTGQAARYSEYSSDLSAFSMDTVSFDPASSLTPTQVLVKVACSAANVVDLKVMCGGLPTWPQTFPFTLSYDLSGVVVARGADVEAFQEGDAVFAVNWGALDKAPLGNSHDDDGVGPVGGAFATYCVMESSKLSKKPVDLPWESAAALALAGTTAFDSLDALQVGEGSKVLVIGGAGAVGAFAVQLAKLHGAFVVTTASDRTMAYVESLGAADKIINYRKENWWEDESLKGFDAVFQAVDETDGFTHAKLVLKEDGSFLAISDIAVGFDAAGHPPLRFASFHMLTNSVEIQDTLAQLAVEGKLKVQIAERFPFTKEGISSMLEQQRAGKSIGKNVLVVDPEMASS